jgi:hypothetical protein
MTWRPSCQIHSWSIFFDIRFIAEVKKRYCYNYLWCPDTFINNVWTARSKTKEHDSREVTHYCHHLQLYFCHRFQFTVKISEIFYFLPHMLSDFSNVEIFLLISADIYSDSEWKPSRCNGRVHPKMGIFFLPKKRLKSPASAPKWAYQGLPNILQKDTNTHKHYWFSLPSCTAFKDAKHRSEPLPCCLTVSVTFNSAVCYLDYRYKGCRCDNQG